MKRSHPIIALALVLSVASITKAETPLYYDLTPFALSAPELQAAFEERAHPGPATKALKTSLDAAQGAPERWRDRHTKHVAQWLIAHDLLTHHGPDAAMPYIQELDAHRSSLIDPLLGELSAALRAQKRESEAAQWSFAFVHTGPAMREGCISGTQDLRKLNNSAIGLQQLTRLLDGTLSLRTRRALILLAAELEAESGDKAAAKKRLRRIWWETSSREVRQQAAAQLKKLGYRIGVLEELAEIAFETRSKDMTAVRRKLKRRLRRTSKTTTKRVIIWARALIAGLDKDKREDSESVVATYTRKLKGSPAEPWALVGHAKALRRLNRDVEAAQVYEDMATRFPEHPLSAHALVEGAGLYMAKGFAREADALYRRTLTRNEHGDAEREALWQVAFGDLLRGHYTEAIAPLKRLIVGYGSERDGLGTTWAERAQYWWARAEAEQGNHADAARLFNELIGRFPMGWYALLSAQRLEEANSQKATHQAHKPGAPSVIRQAMLDYPVALYKLGAYDEALKELQSLSHCGHLPGSGRALLAAIYKRNGDDTKASSILRRHGIFAEVPNAANGASYSESFPYRYSKSIERYAQQANISPAWLAGLVFVESRFNPKARSGAGAIGLAQLMPNTAKRVSKRALGKSVSARALKRVKTNLSLGAILLRRLLNRFKENTVLALAAYNAGSGAATSWLRKRGHLETDAFVETIPYDQTRRYVMRVSSMALVYHRLYGVTGPVPPIHATLPSTLGAFEGSEGLSATEEKP